MIDVKKDGKEIGEIVFFGNICAKEYLKDPEATRKLFAGGGLHSGDLAVWHEDGSAQILDRAKDIIISGTFSLHSFWPFTSLILVQAVRTSLLWRSRPCSYSIQTSWKQASFQLPIHTGVKDRKLSSR